MIKTKHYVLDFSNRRVCMSVSLYRHTVGNSLFSVAHPLFILSPLFHENGAERWHRMEVP